MDALRKEARAHKSSEDYEKAAACYSQLHSDTCDPWISFEYAQCLKKLNRTDLALKISKSLHQRDSDFEYNKPLLAWLLYEKHFSHFNSAYSPEELMKLFEIAIFTTQLVRQDERSPYEIILLKLIKLLKRSPERTEDQQLILLKLLDLDKLSEIPRKTLRKEKELIYQSDKEMAYASKTKALFSKKKYKDCMDCCDEALSKIKRFHHNNDFWIEIRKSICIGKVEGSKAAIHHLERLSARKTHWVLFVEIARLYHACGDSKTALYYYCRAAVTSDPPKMKVKLFNEMYRLLEQLDDKRHSALHAQYVECIRLHEGWGPNHRLERSLNQVVPSADSEISLKRSLNQFWLKKIQEN